MKWNFFYKNKNLQDIFILSIFLFLLFNIQTTKNAAALGFNNFCNIILPTLFPFILITNIIIYFNSFSILSSLTLPLKKLKLNVSTTNLFCITIGFLCGFPVGIKTVSDLYQKNEITKYTAIKLVFISHNISPALNIIIINKISDYFYLTITKKLYIFFIPYISSLLLYFIVIKVFKNRDKKKVENKDIQKECPLNPANSYKNIVDNTIHTLCYICFYIVIFSIISSLISKCNLPDTIYMIICSLIDVTNILIYTFDINMSFFYSVITFLMSFGGISALFQSMQLLDNVKIQKRYLIYAKILSACISVLLSVVLYLL